MAADLPEAAAHESVIAFAEHAKVEGRGEASRDEKEEDKTAQKLEADKVEQEFADDWEQEADVEEEEQQATRDDAATPEMEDEPKAEAKEPEAKASPSCARKRRTFVCDDGGTTSCDLVKKVLREWGWDENKDVHSRKCDLKWSFRSREIDKPLLEPHQLVNHFRGSYFLSNKAVLGQCLHCCEACAASFFPRQHDLRSTAGLRGFLRDYVTLAADLALADAKAEDLGSNCGMLSASEAASRVLRRHKEWSQGDPEQPERLLRCGHECVAIFGEGCLLPQKLRVPCRSHVDVYLSSIAAPIDDCPNCKQCREDAGGSVETGSGIRQIIHDGPMNAWALKEPCVQRGAGVTVLTGLGKLLDCYERHTSSGQGRDCVIQKYIERPLLLEQPWGPAKCDLRCWVLVLDWNPLTAFVHPDVYFRIATKPYCFGTENPEPHAHKTNCRDQENRTPLHVVLAAAGEGGKDKWHCNTWPKLLDAVRATLLAGRSAVLGHRDEEVRGFKQRGPRAFELFGLDFAIDECWNPWLLEMNTSPCMLEDCGGEYVDELKAWAREATESLIEIAMQAHSGDFKIPSYSELKQRGSDEAEKPLCRLFGPDGPDPNAAGHASGNFCLGASVAKVPTCLVGGLDLGGPCSRWRLIIRDKLVDDWQLRTANEELMRRRAQGRSFGEPSALKLLRDWLLPGLSTGKPPPPEKPVKAAVAAISAVISQSHSQTVSLKGVGRSAKSVTLAASLPPLRGNAAVSTAAERSSLSRSKRASSSKTALELKPNGRGKGAAAGTVPTQKCQ
eukprot:TRINITY_DN6883_c0_g1_i2.p1 TRINITY_DN6883_c0_g1~~TRINITY_DN6883_c0_g1_i2.p1  ORF type:complete len:786 (+),score=183.22 TRINITY_DN6883_c0_g1_i2:34-2391(+)